MREQIVSIDRMAGCLSAILLLLVLTTTDLPGEHQCMVIPVVGAGACTVGGAF